MFLVIEFLSWNEPSKRDLFLTLKCTFLISAASFYDPSAMPVVSHILFDNLLKGCCFRVVFSFRIIIQAWLPVNLPIRIITNRNLLLWMSARNNLWPERQKPKTWQMCDFQVCTTWNWMEKPLYAYFYRRISAERQSS